MKRKETSPDHNILEMSKLTENDIYCYVKERFGDLKNKPSMEKLVNYHTNNKYLLMAHSQAGLKELGNFVTNHKKLALKDILENYEKVLVRTLKKEPSTKSHINVLMHIFGYFGKYLNQNEKAIFMQFIKNYRTNKITLGKILSEIEPITYRFNNLYLVSQTYFLLYSEAKMGNMYDMPKPK